MGREPCRLRAARTGAGLSQIELAVKAGIQPGLLCRYERGVAPCQRNALRLARALGCAVEEVFPAFGNLRPY
jgi:transcriptional regulator with XRE-family HTH domain